MEHKPGKTFKALLLSAIILTLMMLPALPMVTASQVSTKIASGTAEAQTADTFQPAPLNPAYLDYLENPSHYSYGYIPPTVDLSHLHNIPVQTQMKAASLPSTFDWRSSGKVTSVKNQNPCGTCWLFGTIAAIESRVLIKEGTAYDFSEQNVACCTDPSWVGVKSNLCNGPGGDSILATDVLTKKGTRLESCDHYNTSTINTEPCNDNCSIIKRVTGYRLVATSADQVTEVKNAVYTDGPVSMAFCSDWIGNSSAHGYPGFIYYWPNCTQPANHLVSIVGWDDTIAHPAGGGSGAWIVKNSWGTIWGNNGYFYLCYGSGNMTEVASYEYKNYNPYETVYYWDEAGLVGSLGVPGYDSAWMASVFTTQQSGNLTNVDFWTTSKNAQYQLYVYDGSFGTQLALQSGTCGELGYYSIPLNTPVARTAGQQFTVAIKMTTPGYNYPLPVESRISGKVEPPIQSGVCFVSLDGIMWQDAGATLGDNVCLRAQILTPAPPAVSTNPATNITTNSATLNGNLTDMGSTASVTVSFEWGNTISYGNETPAQVLNTPGVFSGNITDLNPNTTYHFMAKAVGDGTSYGNDTTFTTSTIPPSVVTNAAGNITASSATLNGNLTAMGTATSVTVSFEWGNTTSYGNETPAQVLNTPGVFSGNITDLNPNTTYHLKAKAIGNGTSYGNDTTFTTTGSTAVTGITRQVDGNILPGVSITLDGIGPVLSDQNGQYEIMATATGSHTVAAHKDGFRDRTRTINIAGLGTGYAVTCNFQGQYGLIPNAPDIWYALDCVNRWLYPPNPDTGLDIWTALDVVNAWLYPVQ